LEKPLLSRREKVLYHQIHPLKLAADISGGIASTWLLWQHEFLLAMLAAFLPAVAASVVVLRWMHFERQRDSAFGRYVAFHMTRVAEAVRIAGLTVIWIGAWNQTVWMIVAGAAVVVLGWTYSLPWWRTRPDAPAGDAERKP
jgi:hypothetical protein